MNSDELPAGKGWFRVVVSLAEYGKTFTEVREDTGLSNGTVQRRLSQLREMGWVITVATLEDEEAKKINFLNGKAYAVMEQKIKPLLDTEQSRPD